MDNSTETPGSEVRHHMGNYGLIESMEIPKGYTPKEESAEHGTAHIYVSDSDAHAEFGVWTTSVPPGSGAEKAKASEVLTKPPHPLSDDEYFKISALFIPGPWTGGSHWHEQTDSLHTEDINGATGIVFDRWRKADVSQDNFAAKPEDADIRRRIVFVPHHGSAIVDVFWVQSSIAGFRKHSRDLQSSLHSIKWK